MPEDYPKNRETELILPPGVFAFVLDETKAKINTICGPNKSNLSATDKLVTYNPDTKRFVSQISQVAAIQTNVTVSKGQYVMLENPSRDGHQPIVGQQAQELAADMLKVGQIENIPGPIAFPLWPSQVATVVNGHHLRSNQYLLVRVYDDEAAKSNWDKSVVKTASSQGDGGGENSEEQSTVRSLGIDPNTLTTGQLMTIKGTEVTFYIPPTGVEVLKDERNQYVRDAVTLERLEYSILLDEGGDKEYVRGPAVVFPRPTQQFITSKTDSTKRKFRAFELQPTSGLYVKVIADYSENGENYKAGQELFITGATQAIYYPRPEHALVTYGNQEKYYAVAIPGGEGRYVLNRLTGEISLVKGPKMFLPNPIEEVVVHRILSDTESMLYYPGNAEVLAVNRKRREESGQDFSHGNIGGPSSAAVMDVGAADELLYENVLGSALRASSANYMTSPRESSMKGMVADAVNRSTKFTPPRTITINSKYEGAPRIEVFSGYAVQVVDSKGVRKTIVGPAVHLLEYDEKLERLSLSKGKPKSADQRIDTVYLKHISNPVSDILSLKTQDLVNVKVQVKYLVRFEEEQKEHWFSVDNYVQYMVDHLRSLIGNAVRSIGVQEFYANAVEILRDTVLGVKGEDKPRVLKTFSENGMTVYDLELISIDIEDRNISQLLTSAQEKILSDSVETAMKREELTLTIAQEEAKRGIATEIATTQQLADKLAAEKQDRVNLQKKNQVDSENLIAETRVQGAKTTAEVEAETDTIRLESRQAELEVEEKQALAVHERTVSLIQEEAKARETYLKAVQPQLTEALLAAANAGVLEKVAPVMGALAFVNGRDLETTLDVMLKGTPAEGLLANLKKLGLPASTNGVHS